MALLTPDLSASRASYSRFIFVAHGMVVARLLMLVWTKQAKPRPGSPWRTFGVNAIFKNQLHLSL